MQRVSVMSARAALVVGLLALLWFLVLQSSGGWIPVRPPSQADGEPTSSRADAADATRLPVDIGVERESASNVGVQTTALVQGRISDAMGAPLAGVSVKARWDGSQEDSGSLSTVSDAQGRFVLELTSATVGELAFSLSGYRPSVIRVRAPCSGLDVTLERAPTLRGRVVQDGAPVAGALVRWSNPHFGPSVGAVTSTQLDGRFAFLDVPWTLDLDVIAPDALPAHQFIEVKWSMQELVITVERGRVVTGTVLDAETGVGIAGASVALWYYGSTYTAAGRRGGAANHAETVISGDDGRFALAKLPTVANPQRAPAWLWVTAPGRAPLWKLVESADRVTALSASLFPAGSVRGRVVDSSGAVVRGQRVYAEAQVQSLCDAGGNLAFRRQDGGYSAMWNTRRPEVVAPFHSERDVFTDAAGNYVMDRLPCVEGGAPVTISLPGGTPRVTVAVRPGEVVVAADLVVPAESTRRCHGTVSDENARPVGGASVSVGAAEAVTGDGGRFDLEVPLVPEGLETRVSASGFVPFRGVPAEGPDGAVAITLVRGGRLVVMVVDRDQSPVPNASVQVFAAGGLADFTKGGPRPTALRLGRADDRGAVLFAGVPDSCDVLVEYSDAGVRSSRRIVEAAPTSAGTIRVTLEDLDLAAATTSALTVHVVDGRTGSAFDGLVLVEAASNKGTCRRLVNGPEVRLDGLFPGEWRLCVTGEGFGARKARIELTGDQRLDVRLGEGLEIAGQVVTATGALTRPVEVLARELGSNGLTTTRTDTRGHFVMAGVEPGDYLLSVEAFESDAFVSPPRRWQQGFASTAPCKVHVAEGTQSAPVTLTVTPVAMFHVVVFPSAADRASASIWSWAQGIRFRITEQQGSTVYDGGPSNVLTTAAELMLPVREGRYAVTVTRRGEILGQQSQIAGETWRLHAR